MKAWRSHVKQLAFGDLVKGTFATAELAKHSKTLQEAGVECACLTYGVHMFRCALPSEKNIGAKVQPTCQAVCSLRNTMLTFLRILQRP